MTLSEFSELSFDDMGQELDRQMKQRPLCLVNGRRVRNPQFSTSTHPPIPLERFLFEAGTCPHYVVLTRLNDRIFPQPSRMEVGSRKSGRPYYIFEF